VPTITLGLRVTAWEIGPVTRPVRFAFSLLLATAFTGCSCSRDATLAKIEEPIEAEVVWRSTTGVDWAGSGHYVVAPTGISTKHRAFLLIEGHDKRPLPDAGWDKHTQVELQADEKATRMAYRKAGGEWRVAYVVSKQHVFLGQRTFPTLDFATAPTFDAAAIELFSAPDLNPQKCVLEEVEKASGAPGIARVLAGTTDAPSQTDWDKAFTKLPEAERAPVLAALEKDLASGSTGTALGRALEYLPIEQAKFAKSLLSIAKKLTAEIAKTPLTNSYDQRVERVALALRAAAVGDLASATPVACELAKTSSPKPAVESALLVLSKAKAPCANADAVLAENLCGESVRCLADPKFSDFCATNAEKATQPPKESFRADPFASLDTALGAWARALSELPAPIRLLRDRTSYAIDAAATRACPATDVGLPCRCDPEAIKKSLCAVSADKGSTPVCEYRVDDQKKRISNVTSPVEGSYREVVLSDYLSQTLRACVRTQSGRVSCFEVAGKHGNDAQRPLDMGGPHPITRIAARDNRVCLLGDRVMCSNLGADLTHNAFSTEGFAGKPKDIAIAGPALCVLGEDGKIRYQRGKVAPEEIPGVAGVTRLTSTGDALSIERDGKPPMYVRCDAGGCKATEVPEATALAVTRGFGYLTNPAGEVSRWKVPEPAAGRVLTKISGIQGAVSLEVEHAFGCALDKAGRAFCFDEAGVASPILDRVRDVGVGSNPVTHAHTAIALRTDDSLWIWSYPDPKPRPVW
jgi:hypothetical protein